MKKIAFVFPGQGSHYSGMGKKVYNAYERAREVYEEASDILGIDIKKICFEHDKSELMNTEKVQLAIFTTSLAMYRAYHYEIGLEACCMAGHSLGEYSALVAAGKIDFQDALKIIQMRGKLMQDTISNKSGCMRCIIGIDFEVVKAMCDKHSTDSSIVTISNYNSQKQNVISGDAAAVASVCEALEKMAAKIVELEVNAPFHSVLMKDAAAEFETYLKNFKFNNTEMPVISNVNAKSYADSEQLYKLLPEQIVKPVMWRESMMYIEELGIDTVIEFGPKTVLKKLTEYNCPTIRAYSCDLEDDFAEISKVSKSCYGAYKEEVDWNRFIEKCIASAICTKNRNWIDQEYNDGVVKPYKEVKESYYTIKDNKEKSNQEQARQAYKMLISVLDTKRAMDDEKNYIMKELFYGIYGRYKSDIVG